MYVTAVIVLLLVTLLGGITTVHAQTAVSDADNQQVNGSDTARNQIVANDDTAISNGIDELAIDILANDIFEGPVSVTVESRHVRPHIIQGLGSAEYNGTHLVYTPGEWAPIIIAWKEPYTPGVPYQQRRNTTEVPYTYTIQDSMNRQTSANVTIHITNPVARAVVSDAESDPKFFVIGYSGDPISGRILDDNDNIIYNFTGIKSGANRLEVLMASYVYTLVPDPRYFELIDYGYQIRYYPRITVVIPEFDPPLEPGTYTYQFARTADAAYAGDDVHAGTFTVPEPSEHVTKVVNRDLSNRDPVAKPVNLTVLVDSTRAFQLPVTDPDGDDLTITQIYGNILGTAFDANSQLGHMAYLNGSQQGRIAYLAGSQQGTDILYYTVSDGRGGSATGKITVKLIHQIPAGRIYVEPREQNQPPIAMDMQVFAVLGISNTIIPNVFDLDDDFSFITNATGATLGTYKIRPLAVRDILYTPNQTGTDTMTYTVSDGHGGTDTGTITIYIREQNDPMPVPDGITGMNVLEAYMSRGLVAYAGVMADREDIAGTMPADRARQASHDAVPGFLLASLVTNGTGTDRAGTEGHDITVSVSATGNVPPVLSPMGDYAINAQDALVFRVPATDYGGGAISYLLSGAPNGAEISGSGIFTWTPGSADVGRHIFTVTAYDRYGAATTESVTVRVLPAGTPNEPPAAPDVTATVAPDGLVTIIPAIYDPDGDPARITGATADAGGAVILSDNGIEYTAGPAPGTETVTYTVRDSRGATATGTITITIQ